MMDKTMMYSAAGNVDSTIDMGIVRDLLLCTIGSSRVFDRARKPKALSFLPQRRFLYPITLAVAGL